MEKFNTSSNASSISQLSDWLLGEQEIEGCDLFQQCQQNMFGEEEFISHDIASVFQQEENWQQQPLSLFESYSSYPLETNLERANKTLETNLEKTNKKLKTNTTLHEVGPLSQTQLPQNKKGSLQKQNVVETKNTQGQGTKRSVAHDHQYRVIAERKRRENLSQCLITLAALIPGLKKIDKASVIGDAIKHVKELQERLRVVEEQNKNSPIESVVKTNKPQLSYKSWIDDGSKTASANNEALPHVDANFLDKNVLIRIQCQKQKSFLLNILVEIQKLHLFVVNSSVLPFGDSIVDITIVAQMGTGYNLTKNDLVKSVRAAGLRFMCSNCHDDNNNVNM